MIVGVETGSRIADERLAVEVGGYRRVQTIVDDQIAEARETIGQRPEELPERLRIDFDLGEAGALTRNTEELHVHL